MRKTYSQKAIEKARELYCLYGGRNHDLIERDMRRAGWEGWRKSILYDKGKAKNARMGWITRHGFDNSLRIYTEKLAESVNNNDEGLYIGIKKTRERLEKRVHSGEASKDEIYQYRDFCTLEINARKNLDSIGDDTLETFVAGYENQIAWLTEIDSSAARGLIKNQEKIFERAKAHYGSKIRNSEDSDEKTKQAEIMDGSEKENGRAISTRKDAGGKRKGDVIPFKR